MRARATSFAWILAIAGAGTAGCSHVEIPYDLSAVRGQEAPVHPLRIAVLPFTDGRRGEDGADDADRFVYQGIEYVHTQLADLRGSPFARITEIIGRHLAASHAFAQVILVREREQAPEADLFMSGQVRRMRGYVEAEAPNERSGRPKDERFVLAEVVLAGVEVREASKQSRILMSADVGWSLFEPRSAKSSVPDPWNVLGEALFRTVSELIAELQEADLSGAHVVRNKVTIATTATQAIDGRAGDGNEGLTFGRLETSPPEGWRFVASSTAAQPLGWSASRPRCREVRLEQKQTLRFHRVLGSYRPAVTFWACPRDLTLRFNALEEFPARYLGETRDNTRYFMRALGESNWPNAADEVSAHLGISPPDKKYTFELAPE